MNISLNSSLLFLGSILFLTSCSASPDSDRKRPNIIYILADDLGYGELGIYGQQKIETPHIDALARSGMIFTDHYSGSPVCAPSRYMLMTGKQPGNAYIRSNYETAPREKAFALREILENPEWEGQLPMPASEVTVAEILQRTGYRTAAIGKWGLGGPGTEGHPNNHGFDLFFGYLCQRQAHSYYPTHLWRNDERILLANDPVKPHQQLPEGADPYDPMSYSLFHDQPDYSAERMHQEALRFIEENHTVPFFLYLPSPIPHISLQAPQRWIDHYVNKFGNEEPWPGGSYVPVRYPNATYAAMISYLDEQVGEIVEKLRELGIYEESLIIFTSDNGPTFTGGVDPFYFDSAAPFRNDRGRTKAYVYEGGIRVPMIAAWKDRIEPGSRTGHISAFWDILPTLAEVTGAELPAVSDGISFLPTLLGEPDRQRQHEYLYWEFPSYGGQQAVRMGRWKGVRTGILSDGNLQIELYDLDADLQEQNDLAGSRPDITGQIRDVMETERSIPVVEAFRIPALGD